jgi:hypothetical protein
MYIYVISDKLYVALAFLYTIYYIYIKDTLCYSYRKVYSFVLIVNILLQVIIMMVISYPSFSLILTSFSQIILYIVISNQFTSINIVSHKNFIIIISYFTLYDELNLSNLYSSIFYTKTILFYTTIFRSVCHGLLIVRNIHIYCLQ